MSQIEIPDWVVSKVLDELFPGNSGYVIPNYRDPMKAALRAALEGWLVPVGQAGSMPGTAGFTMTAFKTIEVGIAEPLYTLRKDKTP